MGDEFLRLCRGHQRDLLPRTVVFSLETTRTSSIRAVGYCPSRSFSRDFTISQMVSSATATPYSASISTPVLYVASTVVVATIRSARTSNVTLAADVERHARGGDRDRMGVGEDLPHRLHRLKGGDLRGGDGIPFLDATGADRADRRRLEPDRTGGHGTPVDVWLPTDVDHLRHDGLRYAARYFSVRPLSIATRTSDANPGGATRARKDVVKSRRRTRKALCMMPGPLDDSVRMGCA